MKNLDDMKLYPSPWEKESIKYFYRRLSEKNKKDKPVTLRFVMFLLIVMAIFTGVIYWGAYFVYQIAPRLWIQKYVEFFISNFFIVVIVSIYIFYKALKYYFKMKKKIKEFLEMKKSNSIPDSFKGY